MRVGNSVTGPSGKLDKKSMANSLLVWKLIEAVRFIDPSLDCKDLIDPKLYWDEQVKEIEERLHITLFPKQERLEDPNGKVTNGATNCLFCGAYVT